MAPFLRVGATVCMAWDGAAGTLLLSVDGEPFQAYDFAVRSSADAGAGLFPVISAHSGCAVAYSMRGSLGLATPSPDYRPFYLVPPPHPPCSAGLSHLPAAFIGPVS